MAAHKKTMCVDTIWGTGHKRTVIFSCLDLQVLQFLRFYDPYLIHLIGKRLIKHMKGKRIPFFHFIQIGKQLCRRKPSTPYTNAKVSLNADWERASRKMADGNLQNPVIRPMIDRKGRLDLRYLHIPHDTCACHIEK